MLHQGTKGTTRKLSGIQQHSNCFPVGSMFSSAAVILLGGIVGVLAYLESSAAETFFVLQGLCSPACERSLVLADPMSLVLVPGGELMLAVSASLSSPSKAVTLKRGK